MFSWRGKPEGGTEHEKLMEIFLDKAIKIEDLPQINVTSEYPIQGTLKLRVDFGMTVIEEYDEFEGIIIPHKHYVLCFEIETDWRKAICKVANYTFANRGRTTPIQQVFFIVKGNKIGIDTYKKLREWLNDMERVGKLRLRWFIIFLDKEEMYELKKGGKLKLIK
ncbi:hypothetical protein DRP05_11765 [Archaeoglobales archaeon]|nr:MAG: hypothetical protein DRP05_11765 [Archaeoglobales archaeon]